MATPTINDLVLPRGTLLVDPDGDSTSTTGVIFLRSIEGCGHFKGSSNPIVESDHILFVNSLATPVIVDGTTYVAMHESAVIGLIPE